MNSDARPDETVVRSEQELTLGHSTRVGGLPWSTEAAEEERMSAKVVCISRTLAAGGEDIARALAERLGFKVVDAEIVRRAADAAGVDAGRLAAVEQRQPLLRRVLQALRPRGAGGEVESLREAALAAAATSGGEV